MSGVSAQARYKVGRNPCPICGGGAEFPHHHKRRCVGFIAPDGEWARCSREELAGAAPIDDKCSPPVYIHKLRGECRCGDTHGEDSRPRFVKLEPSVIYEYRDESRALLFRKLRFRQPDARTPFLIDHPDGADGFAKGRGGARLVPYRLPELLEDDGDRPVYLVEGERDVETLRALGLTATCNPDGAGNGKWKAVAETIGKAVAGRAVIIIADADAAGRPHAREAAAVVRALAASVTLLEPTKGKDVTDHINAGGTLDDLAPLMDPTKLNGSAIGHVAAPPSGFFDDNDSAPNGSPYSEYKEKETEAAKVKERDEIRKIILWGDDLAKPIGPKRWICEGLTIQAGQRPTVICGRGGALKGWFVMAMQICGAASLPLLGFELKPDLKSIYLDWEQTPDTTKERFQLLAQGYGHDLEKLRDRIAYAWQPVLSIAPKTEKELERVISKLCYLTEGFDLANVDSCFSASGFSLEENTSAASTPFRVMTAVSVRTGVTFVCLDHMGKASKDPEKQQSDGDEQRGHSSKGQQVQTRFVMSKAGKGKPTKVRCNRSQGVEEKLWPETFQFAIENASVGCRLAIIAEAEERPISDGALFEDLKRRTLEVVKGSPGLASIAIEHRVRGKAAAIRQALRELADEHRIANRGAESASEWTAI